jgi:hypothetical protein
MTAINELTNFRVMSALTTEYQARVARTSRYSASTEVVPSFAVLFFVQRSSSSLRIAACCFHQAQPKALLAGP